jgi:hypothetical protein
MKSIVNFTADKTSSPPRGRRKENKFMGIENGLFNNITITGAMFRESIKGALSNMTMIKPEKTTQERIRKE